MNSRQSSIQYLLFPLMILLMVACQPQEVDPCEFNLPDCDQVEPPKEKVESEACIARRGDLSFPAEVGVSAIHEPAFIGPLGPFHALTDTTRTGLSNYMSMVWQDPDSTLYSFEYADTSFRWYVNGEEVANQIEYPHVFEEPGLYEIAYSGILEKIYLDGDTCIEHVSKEDTKGQVEVLPTVKLVLTDITYVWAQNGDCKEDVHLEQLYKRCPDIFAYARWHGIRTTTIWNKGWQDDHDHSWDRADTLQLVGNYTHMEFKVYDEDTGSGLVNDDLHHIFKFTPENTQNWSPGTHELVAPAERNGIGSARLKITLEAI